MKPSYMTGSGRRTENLAAAANYNSSNLMIHHRVNFSGCIEEKDSLASSDRLQNKAAAAAATAVQKRDLPSTEGTVFPEMMMDNRQKSLVKSVDKRRASQMSGMPRVSSTDIDEPIVVTEVGEREMMSSLHIFESFNETMKEEFQKIENHTYHLYRSASFVRNSSDVIPCDFLRYVANVDDDLEELAF